MDSFVLTGCWFIPFFHHCQMKSLDSVEQVDGNGNHEVLVSRTLVGHLQEECLVHPNAKISLRYPHEVKRLAEFDLMVLPYSEFEIRSDRHRSGTPHKEVFEKQMLEALDEGAVICFVHHDEAVPGAFQDYSETGYQDEDAVRECFNSQAGLRWLLHSKIQIGKKESVILQSEVKRGEFNSFLRKWGASRNYFKTYGEGKFDDVICTPYNWKKGYATGFCINFRRGLIVYLPLQINHSQPDDFRDSVLSLVDSLLTYKARRIRELPAWAKEPLFEKEKLLQARRIFLLAEVEKVESETAPYEEAKSLLLASEQALEIALPAFISARLGIPTERNEKFVEDFWLLDKERKKSAICEVKSVMKGFKKGAIYDVYNHREKNDFPESFPALLFVNYNLQVGSWAKKDTAIQASDYKIAVTNNVLIVRVEDLVRIWEGMVKGTISAQDVIKQLTTLTGWLECTGGKLFHHA
jgi:hypothetical protein